MKKNMGSIDRGIRLLVVVVIAVLYYMGQLTGLAATILGIVALGFLITSIVGWCPGYLPFGISTRKHTE
jgi:Inner membrane protein YgaP-like, transmembrane domain